MERLKPHVGARVQYKGAKGIVRYLGPLEGQGDVVWAGIEWDNVARGKHSGTHNGHTYFSATVAGSASFIRLAKIGDGGRVAFVEAARRLFADAKDEAHRGQTVVFGRAGVVEIVDEGAMIELSSLADAHKLDLSNMGVAVIGERDEVLAAMPQLTDVCLSGSLFTHMRSLLHLLSYLPNIRSMEACNNTLRNDDNEKVGDTISGEYNIQGSDWHHDLKQLVLNHVATDWGAILSVARHANAIHELRLHDCSLSHMAMDEWRLLRSCWVQLRVLDLDGNQVTWDDVRRLSTLRQLRELYVSRNRLPDTDCLFAKGISGDGGRGGDDGGEALGCFEGLETLSVAENAISGWRLVTWLDALPRLRHLRLVGNEISPHVKGNRQSEVSRWHLRAIGRIGGLTQVDGSWVSADERLFAERRYTLEEIEPLAKAHGLDFASRQHPRAATLLDQFGSGASIRAGAHLAYVDGSSGGVDIKFGGMGDVPLRTLRRTLVRVRMRAGRGLKAGRNGEVVRMLPRNVTAERLAALCVKVLRVEQGQWRQVALVVLRVVVVAMVNGIRGDGEVSVLADGRSLDSCMGVVDADEVCVECIAPA